MIRRISIALAVVASLLVSLVLILVWGIGHGGFAQAPNAGEVTRNEIPPATVVHRAERQLEARRNVREPRDKQILFGDLHVHTTFSSDAFLFSLPILQGEGAHPPADACDFARFCSQLDFWSINDHAELLTPEQWRETKESIRQCNAVAGDAKNPDMVAFLGWEWTNAGETPATHYGHKNIIFAETADEEVPARPVGVGKGQLAKAVFGIPLYLRTLMPLTEENGSDWYLQFNRFLDVAASTPECEPGVDVRELPADCLEYAPNPTILFEKLNQWGFDSLVIPHGTSWGLHAPPGSEFATQLAHHDPERQRLIEVFSGHGNSEEYRSWRAAELGADGNPTCPQPTEDYTPCCWQAGEIIRARCTGVPAGECERRVREARRAFVEAGVEPMRFHMTMGAQPMDWGECGQLTNSFLPAYTYRPGMSVQAALATGAQGPQHFRFGLIGSSDNHTARPGTGYKEYAREYMTDAWGARQDILDTMTADLESEPESVPLSELRGRIPPLQPLQPERGASFYYTGGLVAVHAAGRDRHSIFDSLKRREVYATSGERLLLWFDLIRLDGTLVPMGSEVELAAMPRFRVRAVGAFEQEPGCPDYALSGLGPERVEALCRGECYNPSDRRRPITRIEVVRIRPQIDLEEPLEALIEDPWQVFPCPWGNSGCVVEFADPEFVPAQREFVYYVRAIQEPSPTINGDPLRCERDDEGRCVAMRPCYASGPRDANDDCLAPVEQRAWSSPIFVSPRT